MGVGSDLSDTTSVSIDSGAVFDVDVSDVVGSISGVGDIKLESGATLSAGGNNSSTTFGGVISGDGTFVKQGTGTLTFNGSDPTTHAGPINVEAGKSVLRVPMVFLMVQLLLFQVASLISIYLMYWVQSMAPARYSLLRGKSKCWSQQ